MCQQSAHATALRNGGRHESGCQTHGTRGRLDFYKVVGPAEVGKFCQLVKVGQKYVSGDHWSGTVVAVPEDVIGRPFKKKVKASPYHGACVKIASYAHATPWDGKPQSQTGYA